MSHDKIKSIKEYLVAIKLHKARLAMNYNTTLLFKIVETPLVVIASKEMHLNAHVRQFRELAQEACKTAWHHISVFIPEIEDVAQQIYRCCLVLYAVEKPHQTSLVHPPVLYCP